MKATRFHLQWSSDKPVGGFRTGVSLHSHTLHSKESLDFIYSAAKHCWLLRTVLRQAEEKYRRHHGVELNLADGWWTPPLAPLDAFQVESGQIAALGLRPLVSLSDHDDIEAPMSLQAVDPARAVPVSVEWTGPFGPTFFHLGIHNLPPRKAREIMAELAAFTANPDPDRLNDILAVLQALPDVLLVFNHPLWDEKGVGAGIHREAAISFLCGAGRGLHALEINGLRPWQENEQVIRFARESGRPAISGGDRHALEPNAVLNLSQASTFAEFASEIRDGRSDVFFTSHYRQGHRGRILHNMVDVLGTYDNHGRGWREWPDRVFYRCPGNTVRSLQQLWGDRHPLPVRIFDGAMRMAAHGSIRGAMRAASARTEQVVL